MRQPCIALFNYYSSTYYNPHSGNNKTLRIQIPEDHPSHESLWFERKALYFLKKLRVTEETKEAEKLKA